MKIVTVVGARPQFVKAAAVSRVLRKKATEVLVHTGQHYDENMSDIFFQKLDIPLPDYNLGVGSGSHAKQTGDMLIKIEEVLLKEKPDLLLTYGDTNSTLAASLSAGKLHIPIAHVEAGLRSFNKLMPEEQNRILTDHLSCYLFCPTDTAVNNLLREGITKNVYNAGDVMCDAVLYYSKRNEGLGKRHFQDLLKPLFADFLRPESWYMATVHRAENTDDISKIEQILGAFEQLSAPVLFPVHPRIKTMVENLLTKYQYRNIYFCEPMGYTEMLYFTKNAIKIITDSGGLQKEAYIMGVDCVTVRDQTEWVETLTGNNNILSKPDTEDILNKVNNTIVDVTVKKNYYGDGDAANKILEILTR